MFAPLVVYSHIVYQCMFIRTHRFNIGISINGVVLTIFVPYLILHVNGEAIAV